MEQIELKHSFPEIGLKSFIRSEKLPFQSNYFINYNKQELFAAKDLFLAWADEHPDFVEHSPIMHDMMGEITKFDIDQLENEDPALLALNPLKSVAKYVHQSYLDIFHSSSLCKKIETRKTYEIKREDLITSNGFEHLLEYAALGFVTPLDLFNIIDGKFTADESPFHNPEKFKQILPLLREIKCEHVEFVSMILKIKDSTGKKPNEIPEIMEAIAPLIGQLSEVDLQKFIRKTKFSFGTHLVKFILPHLSEDQITTVLMNHFTRHFYDENKILDILPLIVNSSFESFSKYMELRDLNENTPLHHPVIYQILKPSIEKHHFDISINKNADGISVADLLSSGVFDLLIGCKELPNQEPLALIKNFLEEKKDLLREKPELLHTKINDIPISTLLLTTEGSSILSTYFDSKQLVQFLTIKDDEDKLPFEYDNFNFEIFSAINNDDLVELLITSFGDLENKQGSFENLIKHLQHFTPSQIAHLYRSKPLLFQNVLLNPAKFPNAFELSKKADFQMLKEFILSFCKVLRYLPDVTKKTLQQLILLAKDSPENLKWLASLPITRSGKTSLFFSDLISLFIPALQNFSMEDLNKTLIAKNQKGETALNHKRESDTINFKLLLPLLLKLPIDDILKLLLIPDRNGFLIMDNSEKVKLLRPFLEKCSEDQLMQLLSATNDEGNTPLHHPKNIPLLNPYLEKLSSQNFSTLMDQHNRMGDTPMHNVLILDELEGLAEKKQVDFNNIKNTAGLSIFEILNFSFFPKLIDLAIKIENQPDQPEKSLFSDFFLIAGTDLTPELLSLRIFCNHTLAYFLIDDKPVVIAHIFDRFTSPQLAKILTYPEWDDTILYEKLLPVTHSEFDYTNKLRILNPLLPEDLFQLFTTLKLSGSLPILEIALLIPFFNKLSDDQIAEIFLAKDSLGKNIFKREGINWFSDAINYLINRNENLFLRIIEASIKEQPNLFIESNFKDSIKIDSISDNNFIKFLKIQNSSGQTYLHLMKDNSLKIIEKLDTLTNEQISSLFSIKDAEGNTPLHVTKTYQLAKPLLDKRGINLEHIENDAGISVKDVMSSKLSDHWLTKPKESDDLFPLLTKEEYDKQVLELRKRIISLWDSLVFKDAEHSDGLNPEILNIFGKDYKPLEIKVLLEAMIQLMVEQKAWTGTPKIAETEKLHQFYCKMLSNFNQFAESLENKNNAAETAGYLAAIATTRIEGRCAAAYQSEIRQKKQLAQGKSTDLNMLVKDAANDALQVIIEKIVGRDHEGDSHAMTDYLFAVGMTDVGDALPHVTVDQAQRDVLNEWNFITFMKDFGNGVPQDLAVDWLKLKTSDDFGPEYIELRNHLIAEENQLLSNSGTSIEKIVPDTSSEIRTKILEFMGTFYHPILHEIQFESRDKAIEQILVKVNEGEKLFSEIPGLTQKTFSEFDKKVQAYFLSLRVNLQKETTQQVYNDPAALENAVKLAAKLKYVGTSDEEILKQMSRAELISCLPAAIRMDYSKELGQLYKTEKRVLDEIQAVLRFSEIAPELTPEQNQELLAIKKELDAKLAALGNKLDESPLGVSYYAFSQLLPSKAVEEERRLLPHKAHLDKRMHTLKYMLNLLGVIESPVKE